MTLDFIPHSLWLQNRSGRGRAAAARQEGVERS